MKAFKIIFLLIVTLLSSCKKKEQTKPNVIVIITDQWRASAMGYAGNKDVKTPYLDAFATEAVNFKNAVSVTPVCTPFRASLLTGKYPTTTGMFHNDIYLPSEELTMAEIYKEVGYQTAFLGKWHLDGHGRTKYIDPERRQGFDYWKGSECDHNHLNEHYYANNDTIMKHWEGYSPFAVSSEAQHYMEEVANKKDPFLLYISLTTPHFPHDTALKEYVNLYQRDSLTLPENISEDMKEWALKELPGYYAHCTATDKAIGEVIQKAKELGVFKNSIIVFTSDHGEMMGAHGYRPYMKHQPYLESVNIPFLISYPEMRNTKGKTAKAPITTPDILPSLLSLSGIAIPRQVEGYDLADIIKDPTKGTDRAALFMNLCPFGIAFPDDEFRALKTDSFTYVKTPKEPSMLFDDIKDPLQMTNLVNDPNYIETQKKLNQKLIEELKRIGEDGVKPRNFYLKKFGYMGREEFREDYAIKDYFNVKTVVSPKRSKIQM